VLDDWVRPIGIPYAVTAASDWMFALATMRYSFSVPPPFLVDDEAGLRVALDMSGATFAVPQNAAPPLLTSDGLYEHKPDEWNRTGLLALRCY
jgi:hypothetical protein